MFQSLSRDSARSGVIRSLSSPPIAGRFQSLSRDSARSGRQAGRDAQRRHYVSFNPSLGIPLGLATSSGKGRRRREHSFNPSLGIPLGLAQHRLVVAIRAALVSIPLSGFRSVWPVRAGARS